MTYNPGMRRRAAGALIATGFLLLILSPVGAVATPLPDRSEPWIKVRTAHFALFSNASEQYTVEIGMDLERFREALARLVSGLEINSPLPTSIYVFKHDASFQPYKMRVGLGPANISGAFAAHRDGNYVGINATPSTDPWSVIYHEYVHYFLINNFTDIPLWFNEGTAECFSTFRAAGGKVEIGRPIDDHVDHLKTGKWIALSDLFAIDACSKDYNEGERQGTFYAESWALVHYLAWGRTDAQAHFQAALLADPSYAPAYAGMGYLRDLQKRNRDAAGYYEKALALNPDDALTLFLYAESLITQSAPTGPTPPDLTRARDLYC